MTSLSTLMVDRIRGPFTARFNAYRFGAAAFPLPGVGFVMKNWETTMYVALIKVADMLEGGIIMTNATKFL